MAISRGAGTEIIRTICLEDVTDTTRNVIVGVQHHIYTVLSITVFADTLNAAGDYVECFLIGFDANGGTSAQTFQIFRQDLQLKQTFVWNDKFSFNGCEPDWSGHSGDMSTAAEQDAIADQGTTTSQVLKLNAEHSSDRLDVICTYIDQNNA